MATNTVSDIQLLAVGSHSIVGGNQRIDDREELFPRFSATWRGAVVHVTMEANRYRFASGEWSEWRVFARAARFLDATASNGLGSEVSDLARSRLSATLDPFVRGYLASPNYAEKRLHAFQLALRNEISDLRPYRDATNRVLGQIDTALRNRDITEGARDALTSACYAFDAFTVALDRVAE